MKKHLLGIIYGLLLTAFTAYVLLDTFVITRVYVTVPADDDSRISAITESTESIENTEITADTLPEKAGVILTDSSYSDENITITITECREKDTTIYVADVQLTSAEYLKTAFADNVYGKNITAKTSVTAEENGALLAINGDYYGARESGYVLRNGVLYRTAAKSDQEDLVIWQDGSFQIFTEESTTAQSLQESGAQQILSFGPALVADGQITVTEDDEVGKAKASNPRTAIGIIDDLHYVFVVSDGRTDASAGLSLYQLAAFMQSLGTTVAYNLDGGGSSTMVFNGKVINNPTTSGKSIKERSVSDIVYIGY